EGPTLLADGDVIQFSARGPKVLFSLREAAAAEPAPFASETVAIVPEALERPQPPPTAAPPPPSAPSPPGPPSPRPFSWWIMGAAGAIVLVTGLVVVWTNPSSWTPLYIAAGIVLVGAAIGGAWLWWRGRKARRAQATGQGLEAGASAEAPVDLGQV